MREEFLYYIWENRLTDKDLKTAEGETVEFFHREIRRLEELMQ